MGIKASGDRPVSHIKPPLWNRVVESMLDYERRQLGDAVPSKSGRVSTDCVKVINSSGGDLARGSVLRCNGDINTGLDEYEAASLWFTGSTPNTNDKWGILRKPLPYGVEEYGELQVSGVVIARVDVLDADHTHARPVSGQTYLQSSSEGPLVILDKPTGTGELECVVVFRQTQSALIRFILAAPLDLGSEAAAYKYEWNGSAYAATTEAITVKDFTATPGSWQGLTGFVGWATLPADNDDGKYEIVWMENIARFIDFTSTEDMGATTSGEMAVTLTGGDWYDIKQPTASPLIVTDPLGLFTRAKSGAKGKARYNPKTDEYVIVECQTKAGWIRGTLTADVSSGSSSAATVSDYGGSQQDVQSPGSTVTVYDPAGHFTRAKTGATFFAVYDAVDDKYNLVECQSLAGWIRGALTADMASSSAAASVTDYGGSQQDVQSPGSTLTVYDPSDLFLRAKSGAKFKAIYDAIENKYILVECEQMAIAVLGLLQGAMTSGDSTFTIDNLTILEQTPFNQSPGSSITANNTFGFAGDDNAAAYCVRSGTTWYIIQVTCPA